MRLIIHKNFAFSILTGLFLSFSLPNFYVPFAFLIGYFLFFKVIINSSSFKTVSFYSFIVGFVFSMTSFYWILFAIIHYGGVNKILGLFTLLGFSAIFSIYFVIFGVMQRYFLNRYGLYSLFLAPFIIVLLEISREFFPFGGFPWNLNGYMISYIGNIIEISSFFGIYGLTFLVLFLSVIFFIANEKRNIALLFLGFTVFVLISLFPSFTTIEGKNKYKIAIIQGNIEENIKQKQNIKDYAKYVSNVYIRLIEKASRKKPDIIVLPESALPFDYLQQSKIKSYFLKKIKNIKIPILAGFDHIKFENGKIKIFNAFALIDTNKQVREIYYKVKLVPFGEYTPSPFGIFSKIFPYLEGFDFSSGSNIKILQYKDLRTLPLICFEVIFPNFVADGAKNANLIVNVSNDAWFGKTSAPFQHLEMAKVRAVETGRYLVRATNTGFSAIISPDGKFEKVSKLFNRQILIGEVYTLSKSTFYVKYRQWLFFIFVAIFILILSIFEVKGKDPSLST